MCEPAQTRGNNLHQLENTIQPFRVLVPGLLEHVDQLFYNSLNASAYHRAHASTNSTSIQLIPEALEIILHVVNEAVRVLLAPIIRERLFMRFECRDQQRRGSDREWR